MNARQKCELINQIRKRIADANGIDFKLSECSKAKCPKYCEKSNAELEYLEGELERIQNEGKKIDLKGIFALEIDEKSDEEILKHSIDRQERLEKLPENPALNGLPPRYLDSLLD